ncbi:MAG: hypothetical protein HY680_00270 [Chloroflexi bacterium]|nr:hypothetical protein [Chloroflexota bacterium]
MPKETVLARVEADVERGDLGKARDRLHTLVHDNPNDLALRARLAEVYHRLQFPAMAGRYWYLWEHRTPEMKAAVAAFERSCGSDPLLMLSAIKFRGDLSQVSDHAKGRLTLLQEAVQAKYNFSPGAYTPSRMLWRGRGDVPYRAVLKAADSSKGPPSLHWRGFIRVGHHYVYQWIVLAGVVVAVLVGIGLFTVASWVYEALR